MSTASLLFAAAFLLASQVMDASAQNLVYPSCPASWSWSFNSLGQSPCAVAAYLQGACNNGVFTIPTLSSGNSYVGPTGAGDDGDLCKCNTVVYSLMSACDACQGAKWFSWSSWSHNCTATDRPTTYSNIIPTGTSVSQWAFLDVTKNGTWDPVLAYQVGGSLEITAGVPGILGETPTATATGTRVPGLSPTQVSQVHGGSSSKRIAAITGGLLGGLAFLAAAVALLLWLARIRRRQQTRAAASVMFPGGAVPLKEKVAKRQSDDVFVQPKRDEAI